MTYPFQEFLVKALHEFATAETSEDRWKCAVSLLEGVGVVAMNVAVMAPQVGVLSWFRSTMNANWISYYIAEHYNEADPLMAHMSHSFEAKSVQTGLVNQPDNTPVLGRRLNHDAYDAGYGGFFAKAFPGSVLGDRKIISLASEAGANRPFAGHTGDELQLFATVLAANVGPPDDLDPAKGVYFADGLLSLREREVLTLLAAGWQNVEIAYRLGLAEVTIRKHLQSARRKLNAQSREQALVIALRMGLINP